ncbi:hypothetical protein KM043_012868 [Ampulex compressa]|nr:hypothetical protein KM043_012868 [Ampulex compressa]
MARIRGILTILSLTAFCTITNANEYNEDDIDDATLKTTYKSPEPPGFAYFVENFDDQDKFNATWVLSQAKKEDIDEDIAKYDGKWELDEPTRSVQTGDLGLVLKSKARHAAISAPLSKHFHFEDKPLIVQYEVNFQEGQECGGAYLKLLTVDEQHTDLKLFHDKTPYTIMFGPDKCGNDHKLHFIFQHKNPLNGSMEEKHCKKPKERLEDFFKDKQPHLYTLIVQPNNTFEIKVDNKAVNYGSLLDDFDPPVNPPLEIEDPNDTMPDNWDNREKIPDPLAVKPDDWDEDAPAQIVDEDDVMPEGWLEDEPPMIPNPNSVKPEDWDIEMDGEWEPPEIQNPKCVDVPGCGPYSQKMKKNPRYKGRWKAPLINNPNYKGKWKPKLIHNPHYFNDEHPFLMQPIHAIGFELWSMSTDILFDNLIITDSEEVAKKWADSTFEVRRIKIAEESETLWGRLMRSLNYKPGCSGTKEKCDIKDEDKQPLETKEDNTTAGEDEQSKEPADETEGDKEKESEAQDAEIEAEGEAEGEGEGEGEGEAAAGSDTEKVNETEELIESDKEKLIISGDGPRRRKPNKE